MNIRRFKNYCYRIIIRIYGWFHPIEKKVLFSSFGGKQYSDNPRAISEKLHLLFPDYRIVWMLKDLTDSYNIIPAYVEKVKTNRRTFIREYATSFCIVNNENLSSNIYKRKGQFIIQTWHGDLGFKKILYDIPLSQRSAKLKVWDEFITDLCIAGSDFGESVYKTAFNFKGEILKVGMPRNDKIININEDEVEIIKKRLNIPIDKKIVIFAPTFRDNIFEKQFAQVDIEQVLCTLNKKTNYEWICLLRAHSASKGIINNKNNELIIDVTDYPDMADLLLISNMLITDYSSSAGDYVRTVKPTILAMFDKKEYENDCREMIFNPEKKGFVVAYNQNQLIDIISNNNNSFYEDRNKKVCKNFNVVECGRSSEIICKRINDEYIKFLNKGKTY